MIECDLSQNMYLSGIRLPGILPGIILLLILSGIPIVCADKDTCESELSDAEYQHLEEFYKDLHQNPELSGFEANTSAKIAEELRSAGYEVTEHVGGYGVVGVLVNGKGPVIGIRGDMDALPITEKTGLPYASRVTTTYENQTGTGVMHACGHDSHSTVLVGTARSLAGHRHCWNGTLVIIAQPAEEPSTGAKAMIDDGLFTRFPRPDLLIGVHSAGIGAGNISYGKGAFMGGKTSLDVIIRGYGGHGGLPQKTIDPVVIAADAISTLQTLVSRENRPGNPISITVGAIHAGNRENIISEEVRMKLDIRAPTYDLHQKLETDIKRVIDNVARAHGVTDELMPEYIMQRYTPPVVTDPVLADKIGESLNKTLGAEHVSVITVPLTASEDFSFYGITPEKISTGYLIFGGPPAGSTPVENEKYPPGHNPRFAIDPEPSLKTAIRGLSGISIDLMNSGSAMTDRNQTVGITGAI